MSVATQLAEDLGAMPGICERIARPSLREQGGREWPPADVDADAGAAHDGRQCLDPVRRRSQDATQRGDRTFLTRRGECRRVAHPLTSLDRRDHDRRGHRWKHRRGDQGRYLAEKRRPRGVKCCRGADRYFAPLANGRIQAEADVALMALASEVHALREGACPPCDRPGCLLQRRVVHRYVGSLKPTFTLNFVTGDRRAALRRATRSSPPLAYAEEHRIPFWEASIARDSAGLEAVHGELEHALSSLDTAIDSSHRAGNVGLLFGVLVALAMFFDRFDRPEIAATVYGAAANHTAIHAVIIDLHTAVDHLRSVLGESRGRRVCRHRHCHDPRRRHHLRPLKLFCEDACPQFLTGESL